MSSGERNLLRHIADSEAIDYAVFGTYTFNPSYFEEDILKILDSLGVRETIVLLDEREYRRCRDAQLVGKRYYLDYVPTQQVFHPKFCLLVGVDYVKVLLGSFNLTPGGWEKNGELAVAFELSSGTADPEDVSGIKGTLEFLDRIAETERLQSPRHLSLLGTVRKEAERAVGNIRMSDETRILHNIGTPILPQVLEIMNGEDIQRVNALAPQWDVKGKVLEELADAGCRDFRLYLQHDRVDGFPHEIVPRLREDRDCNVTIYSLEFDEEEQRYLHAKTLIVSTDQNQYHLIGSANMTGAALLSAEYTSNVELSVLRRSAPDSDSIDILDTDLLNLTEIELEDVRESPPPEFEEQSGHALRLNEALLKDHKVIVRYPSEHVSSSVDQAGLILTHDDDEKLGVPGEVQEPGVVTAELDDDGLTFCGTPTMVYLGLKIGSEVIKSDWRWLAKERLTRLPPQRLVREGERSDWRYGLVDILNEYGSRPEDRWILDHFLRNFEFPDVDYPEDGNGDGPPRPPGGPGSPDQEKDLEDPEARSLSKIRKEAIKRFRRKLKKAAVPPEEPEDWSISIERAFNRWVSLWKLVLWFVLRTDTEEEVLIEARKAYDEYLGPLLDEGVKEMPRETHASLMEDLEIPAHLLIVSYLVDRYYLQKQDHEPTRRTVRRWMIEILVNQETFPDDFEELEDLAEYVEIAREEYADFEEIRMREDLLSFFMNELIDLAD